MLNPIEHPTSVHETALTESDPHENLVLPLKHLHALDLDFQGTLHGLPAHYHIRVLFDAVLAHSLIFISLDDSPGEQFPRPDGNDGISNELHDVAPILVYGLGHDVQELGGLRPQLLVEGLLCTEVALLGQILGALRLRERIDQWVLIIELFDLGNQDRSCQGLTLRENCPLFRGLVCQVMQDGHRDELKDLVDVLGLA
jgi:hypothetical protein